MTRRAVLNITTKKKRDTMQAVSYNSDTGVPAATARPGVGGIFQGGRTNMIVWSPTARDLTDNTGNANSSVYESGRTASTVFLRLLSEKIRVSTSDSTPWIWRRIVISTKSSVFKTISTLDTVGGKNTNTYIETSNGMGRLVEQFDSAGLFPQTALDIRDTLFRGKESKDWSDPITAPVDNLNQTVLYDKTTVIRSGNDSGTYRMIKRTHAFNKTFRYFEDENGQFQDSSFWSSTGKGFGDVFILDFFSNFIGGATSLLRFEPEATMYWHER